MAQYKVIIDNDTEFILFHWEPHAVDELHLATDDLTTVKNAFNSFSTLSIVDSNNNEIANFTQYNGFSSINFLGVNYSGQLDEFANELVVTLTKIDLVSQVQRIDEQINPIIDIDKMSLQEYKNWKIAQFSKMGEQLIFEGTDVTLLNGVTKHFTYNLEDQSNLLNAIFIIQTLGDLTISLPYHSHGEACELYDARDILAVYFTLQFFSTRIQTEVNMKINWVRSCQTKEEVEVITFESELPQEWAERAQAIMGPAMELAEQLQATYFGPMESTTEGESNE